MRLMNPPLATELVPKVLHGVGHEHLIGGDPGPLQAFVEDPGGRANERLARDVLGFPWLLTDASDGRDGIGGAG